MIIDSFPFHNELDILRVRLEELKDVVDYHVLVECNRTQSRLPKPFFYRENKHLFKDFEDKIIDIQVEDYVKGGEADWQQEIFIRQSILNGLNKLDGLSGVTIRPTDYLIVSDLDEIPMASKVKSITDENPIQPISINHYFISYFYNMYCPSRGWWGSVITNIKNVLDGWSPQALRASKDTALHAGKWNSEFFGWHFSSCTSFDGLWDKWHNNIEPHYKAFLYEEGAKERYRKLFYEIVVDQKRFFYCDDIEKDDIKLDILPLDKLPIYMQQNIHKYKNLIVGE